MGEMWSKNVWAQKGQTCRLCAGVSSRTTGGANSSKKSRGTCSGTCTTCGAQNRKYLPADHSQQLILILRGIVMSLSLTES